MLFWSLLISSLVSFCFAAPRSDSSPRVVLDKGEFVGEINGTTNCFLGIPYAKPAERYRQAEPNDPYFGIHNATNFGPSCPGVHDPTPNATFYQDYVDLVNSELPGVNAESSPVSEDCLTANIWTPIHAKPGDDYPVVVFIHLGAFVQGGSTSYNGGVIVERSMENGTPIIYVSINYRLAAFGFLPGKEAKAAGVTNLGMRDQREALRWVQRYIRSFGGDPGRVTIWGVNAGAESVGCQMLANNGDDEGLFSAAVMQSGFPLPLNTYAQLQSSYDAMVNGTNCTAAADTLECLRHVPFDTFSQAMAAVPTESRLAGWQNIIDYDFIQGQPPQRMMTGLISRVPYIVADTDDEGTQTASFLSSITTDEEVAQYVQQLALPGISDEETAEVLRLYPADPAQGSPFGTGDANELFPQYKRLGAIIGDLEFQGWRRFFLNVTSEHQPAYSYVSKYFKDYPILGASTVTDLLDIYAPGTLTDYLINFVAFGQPDNGTGIYWPRWIKSSPKILSFTNDSVPVEIIDDTFREEAINLVVSLNLAHPE
ncbi:hypothetical protein CERSUDRAFT_159848 [Gelatoporia subvermispora B]|uniref:Carboxylesterase type B domain-containing protein n=1 Tax=Ceriporiopsis subvermispora (strain B) TaxID=914234 RepID=M2R654_CERS8|nr:hypothetical protein CERSUDRAFT_159848 [Gelatoporia subvermispora B]